MSALTLVKKFNQLTVFKDKADQRFIKLDKVRLSFAYIGTPAQDKDDNDVVKPKWRSVLMLPKSSHTEAYETLKKIIENIKKEAEAKVPADKIFLQDGDESEIETHHGHWIVSASDPKVRPTARDRRGNMIDDIEKIDEMFYSGCWANVMIRPWYFSGKAKNGKSYPKRILAGLTALQFFDDDTPFGAGRVDESDAWDDLGGKDGAAVGAGADLDEDDDL